ncbi:HNH endonuclease signature motif containing protein [Streptomyces sp. NPDC019396]|uniref:HNH endonuclease signature motif containing protein n=1 Tax=Streptomyces sp. NPDC019396 TaxID=3154687 RepID=UPI003402018E
MEVGVHPHGCALKPLAPTTPAVIGTSRALPGALPHAAAGRSEAGLMEDAFRQKIEKWLVTEGEHQLWRGGCDGKGTPVVHWQGRKVGVRRQLFLLDAGLPSSCLKVRPTCGDALCVAPTHAELCRSGRAHRFQGVWERIRERVTPMGGGCLVVGTDAEDGETLQVHWRGRQIRVSRAVWEEHNGPVPDGLVVAHSCRRAACVALDHLYLSTYGHEIALSTQRGLFAGEAHWNHKLTEDQVRLIRSSPLTSHELAVLCGVTPSTISNVRTHRTWNHL